MMSFRKSMVAVTLAALLSACGDSSSPPANTGNQPLAAGNYTLAFSLSSTAQLPTSIGGITVAVRLPAGISVGTGTSGPIAETSLSLAEALQGSAIVQGNYSSSTRTAYLAATTTDGTYRQGHFFNLLLSVPEDTTVTRNDILALNAIYPVYQVVGYNPVTHDSVTLTDNVRTVLAIQ